MCSTKKVYNFEVADWHTYFVGAWNWLVHNAGKACLKLGKKAKKVRRRIMYMGKTPNKASKIGQEVWERQVKEGTAKILKGKKIFQDPTDLKWYAFSLADMGHKVPAVRWWNLYGRKTSAKNKEVRAFMTKSSNYALEYFKNNRKAGSIIGKTDQYKPPI